MKARRSALGATGLALAVLVGAPAFAANAHHVVAASATSVIAAPSRNDVDRLFHRIVHDWQTIEAEAGITVSGTFPDYRRGIAVLQVVGSASPAATAWVRSHYGNRVVILDHQPQWVQV